MDSNKPAQNIQDSFLNTARKERLSITIYLLSREVAKINGSIRSFDKYSVVLEANGQERTHLQACHLYRGDGASGLDACGARDASRQNGGFGNGDGGGKRFRQRRIRRFRLGKFTYQEIPRRGA